MPSLRQRADRLASEIQVDYAKLQVLDEAYNQARAKVLQLEERAHEVTAGILRAARSLSGDRRRLRSVAIDAYVQGGDPGGVALLMSSKGTSAPMQQAYMNAASGNLAQAEANLRTAEHTLTDRRVVLSLDERSARAAQKRIGAARALADQITAQLESELSSIKGRLAAAVAAAEQRKQIAAEAAAQAAALARTQQVSAPKSGSPPASAPAPVGAGAGGVAVRAAESQLGVPYVWGGATPGVGFDCSGLTMWSWAQAGVSLAHGATEQYYEIAHVSMSNLQPGDLIFYGNASYLYHVVMYVGSGPYGADTVIQAETTGTNVMFTPIPPGAYGAGRP